MYNRAMAGSRTPGQEPGAAGIEPLAEIVGDSPAIRQMKALVRRIASTPVSTVLVRGASGTGKNLIAKAIHASSDRAGGPFLTITCSALPETLLESELFGHERGAFTDAKHQRKGLLEQAGRGSVLLDEIGEVSPALQVKLLHFLEERTFRRVGGAEDLKVDARIIAATNRDLEAAVVEGTFREDLYYRLSVLPVNAPPLSAREGDIPLLVRHFMAGFNREFGKRVERVAPQALDRLEAYDWPGNVRELRNVVERAMLLADSAELAHELVLLPVRERQAPRFELPAEGLDLESLERDLVVQAVERTAGNLARAGRLLGMSRDQVRYRIAKFGLHLELHELLALPATSLPA